MASGVPTLLESLDCHFGWGINDRTVTREAALTSLDDAILGYNIYRQFPVRRFAMCLHASLVMFKIRKDGAHKILLRAANRILENSRDPTSPSPPSKMPHRDSPLWELPCQEFFNECENIASEQGVDKGFERVRYHFEIPDGVDGSAAVDVQNLDLDGTLSLWREDRFSDIYTGARHVATALEANMLYREDFDESRVEGFISETMPANEMSSVDSAFIRYVEAISWKLFGHQDKFLSALECAILADPNNVRWHLFTLEALSVIRANRNIDWGRLVLWKSVRKVIELIDFMLDLNLAMWIVNDLNFEKLQAVNSVFSNARCYNEDLHEQCFELSSSLVTQTSQPEVLAYCAQILSRRKNKTMDLALSTIDRALANATDCNRSYVNKRASNVFKNAKMDERSLICAETAARESFGAKWQVLEIKTRLAIKFDPEEFFRQAELSCKHPVQYELFRVEAFLYYVSETDDIKQTLLHFKALMALARENPSKEVMGDRYSQRLKKRLNLATACYSVICHALDLHQGGGGGMCEEEMRMCVDVKEALEKEYPRTIRRRGKLNLQEYVSMLKGHVDKIEGDSDKVPRMEAKGGNENFDKVPRKEPVEKLSWRREMRPTDYGANPAVPVVRKATTVKRQPCSAPNTDSSSSNHGFDASPKNNPWAGSLEGWRDLPRRLGGPADGSSPRNSAVLLHKCVTVQSDPSSSNHGFAGSPTNSPWARSLEVWRDLPRRSGGPAGGSSARNSAVLLHESGSLQSDPNSSGSLTPMYDGNGHR